MAKRWTKKAEDNLLKVVKHFANEGHKDFAMQAAKQLNLTPDQVTKRLQKLKAEGRYESPTINTTVDVDAIVPSKVRKKDVPEAIKVTMCKIQELIKEANLSVKKIAYKGKNSSNKPTEESILLLSDIHIGMVNEVFDATTGQKEITYNKKICEQEMNTLFKGIVDIKKLLDKAYNLKTLNIFLLGDIVTNDRIFDGQQFSIDGCVGEQIWTGVGYLVALITKLATIYEKINIVGIVGNHGRTVHSRVEEPVENNFEYHLYKIIQVLFKDNPQVSVKVPDTYTYIEEVCGWRHLLTHGNNFRGSSEMSLKKQAKELYINAPFDFLDLGHFHIYCDDLSLNENTTIKRNACWIPQDAYGFERFKQYSVPKQWFFGCNKKRPETWSYRIDLRR